MSIVNKYRIYCNTESAYHYSWGETEPTICPINVNHEIDSSKTSIMETIDELTFKIKEENVPTGGNFHAKSIYIDAAPNTTTYKDFSWDYDITVFSLSFVSKDCHEDDSIDIALGPDTIIGASVYPISPGDRTFYVSPTVTQYANIGFHVSVTDYYTNRDDLGYITAIDKVNGTITTSNPAQHSYSPYSPTYVLLNIFFVKDFLIGPAWLHEISKKKIGGAHLPAHAVVRLFYTNNSDEAKRLVFHFEYTY